jgi:heterodisulfide reductase subunit A-like polyferredoxin
MGILPNAAFRSTCGQLLRPDYFLTIFYEIGMVTMSQIFGSVMVVGGGIAGMQAALDLADSGFFVYLVERSSSIGGIMSQLDKTFPTNDCAM